MGLDRDACIGWLLYSSGEEGFNPYYAKLYEKACKKRGMIIKLHFISRAGHPGVYYVEEEGKAGSRTLGGMAAACRPAFAVNRTRDWRLAQELEAMGICVFNNSAVSLLGNDKAEAYKYMAGKGIAVMPTVYGAHGVPPWYPAVVKSVGGHGGTEVYLIKDYAQWERWNQNCRQQGKEYLLQKAASGLGRDVRVYIVGGKAVAAVQRCSEHDFRSNLCLGGKASLYQLSAREQDFIQKAVSGLSIGMAGIDFLFHEGEMVFNEIEDMVGARGLYSLTDYDIVDGYIGYIQEELCHAGTGNG